jgi:hypothetical protein
MSIPTTDIKTPNDGAKYWREFIGVETLPAKSREKKPSSFWKRYQDPAKPDELTRFIVTLLILYKFINFYFKNKII